MDVVVAATQRRHEESKQMSSTATRFLAQIRRNLESWRTGEIDFVTFTESQRDAWAGIHAAGPHVEAEVLRALSGTTCVGHLLLVEDAQQRTVQLPIHRRTGLPPSRHYRGVFARTPAGSPVLTVSAADARSRHAEHRHIAAIIYEIAADLERRSQGLEVHWTITADPENSQVVIELTGEHEAELADELVGNVMAEHQLI